MAEAQVVFKEIKESLKKLVDTEQLLINIAREMYVHTSKRIFTDGVLTDGSKLQISSKPTLAGRQSFPNKKGFDAIAGSKKKRSDLKWVTLNKGQKLFEVSGGYKKIKELSGRTNPFDFTGQLKKSYSFGIDKKSSTLGFVAISRKNTIGGASKATNAKIIEGLENMKGDIFSLTTEEDKKVDEIIDNYLERIL